jgi:thiamine biosynthesis lipoprotein
MPVVSIAAGGLASSSTSVRRWGTAAGERHHVIDPRTGSSADTPWRTVSVAAASCFDANTASTAAIVFGTRAPDWLEQRRLPARLVARDGSITVVGGWPTEEH